MAFSSIINGITDLQEVGLVMTSLVMNGFVDGFSSSLIKISCNGAML